jgi:DHA2 family multidrug resistance protein
MAETGFKKWIITITVIIASLLELIDTTIVNVSLPDIQGNLGATLEDIAWVVTGYAVANVIILPYVGLVGKPLWA